jgi:hypothetical protein
VVKVGATFTVALLTVILALTVALASARRLFRTRATVSHKGNRKGCPRVDWFSAFSDFEANSILFSQFNIADSSFKKHYLSMQQNKIC